jgi:DNA-binding CsgD family transcriptional regulator
MPESNNLSEREREILSLVAKGSSNKEIARDLHISPNTVKVHLRNIFTKVGVNSRTEAAMYAVNTGIVDISGNGSTTSQQTEPQQSNRILLVGLGIFILLLVVGIIGIIAVRGTFDGNQAAANQPILPEEQRWQDKAPMSEARKGLALAAYGGEIFAIAGETAHNISGLVERYDPILDRWSTQDPKPVPVTDVAAAVIGGKIYIPGGRTQSGEITDILEIYSPLEGSWENGADLPVGLSGYAIVPYEGNLYLFGGWDGETYRSTVYEYNPELDRWREMSAMSTVRGFAGAAVAGGKIYVVGGYDGRKGLTSIEVYIPEMEDTAADPWSEAVALPAGRYGMGVAGLGNMIHVVGGELEEGVSQSSLVYSPQDGVWQEFDSPDGKTLTNLGLVPLDTQLYLMGGQIGDDPTTKNSAYQAIYTFVIPIIR